MTNPGALLDSLICRRCCLTGHPAVFTLGNCRHGTNYPATCPIKATSLPRNLNPPHGLPSTHRPVVRGGSFERDLFSVINTLVAMLQKPAKASHSRSEDASDLVTQLDHRCSASFSGLECILPWRCMIWIFSKALAVLLRQQAVHPGSCQRRYDRLGS